jgi:pyruvate formate lyase activating enzyme
MQLGGLQKNSFIDFPGKVSCVLFTSGCNFDCPYCHNPDLARACPDSKPVLPPDGIYDFLEKRRTFLDGVVISGGEPTLQKNLLKTCERIKELGYSLKLDTNGSRPEELRRLIDQGLVDYIAMDIKTDPLYYYLYIKKDCNPEKLMESIQIIMNSHVDYEFRTTCVRPLVNEKIIGDIAMTLKGARLYALQQFNHTEILHPEFFENTDNIYGKEDLEHFRRIAEPWVTKCIAR